MINSFDVQYFQQQPELCVWSNEKFTCSVAQDVSIDRYFYITESARGRDDRDAHLWLATLAGDMGPFCSLAISRVGRARKSGYFDFQGRSQLFNINHGQKSLGQYCIIHIFLSFLGSLIKQYTLFEIFLQFSLPQPYTKLKLRKILDTCVHYCLWGEARGRTWVNWKTPQKCKSVPRLLSRIVG